MKSFMVQSQRSVKSEAPDQGLAEVLVRRCCEDPDEILLEALA